MLLRHLATPKTTPSDDRWRGEEGWEKGKGWYHSLDMTCIPRPQVTLLSPQLVALLDRVPVLGGTTEASRGRAYLKEEGYLGYFARDCILSWASLYGRVDCSVPPPWCPASQPHSNGPRQHRLESLKPSATVNAFLLLSCSQCPVTSKSHEHTQIEREKLNSENVSIPATDELSDPGQSRLLPTKRLNRTVCAQLSSADTHSRVSLSVSGYSPVLVLPHFQVTVSRALDTTSTFTNVPLYSLLSVPPHTHSQEHGAGKVLSAVKTVATWKVLSPYALQKTGTIVSPTATHLLITSSLTSYKKLLKWLLEICFVYLYIIQSFFCSERVAGFPWSYIQSLTT